jgi:hypothetical protein
MVNFQNYIQWSRPPSKMAIISEHSFNIGPYGKYVLKSSSLKPVSQFKAHGWSLNSHYVHWRRPSWMEVGVTGHNFESWPPKDHSCHVCFKLTHYHPVLTYINNQKHKVMILVIFIHQSFLQYISFHSMWAIQRETERNSGLGSSWSSFCGTLSLISQLIYDDIAKMFHLTAGNG